MGLSSTGEQMISTETCIILERLSIAKESLSRMIDKHEIDKTINIIIEKTTLKLKQLFEGEKERVNELIGILPESRDLEESMNVIICSQDISRYEDIIVEIYSEILDKSRFNKDGYEEEYRHTLDSKVIFARKESWKMVENIRQIIMKQLEEGISNLETISEISKRLDIAYNKIIDEHSYNMADEVARVTWYFINGEV